MRPAIVSGIVTGHAPISYWPFFFSLSLATSQKSSKGANWRSEIFTCPHYLSRFETSLYSPARQLLFWKFLSLKVPQSLRLFDDISH